jgi:hypothetical protein
VDLLSEFHGSRTPSHLPLDLPARCRALQVLLDERHAFTGPTAALLWGMPLPRRLELAPELHVASAHPTRAIRHRGTIGTETPATWRISTIDGVRAHAPSETWASLARRIPMHDLVAAAEFLITPRRRSPLRMSWQRWWPPATG